MKRKIITVIVCSLILSLFSICATADVGNVIFFSADEFAGNMGTWKLVENYESTLNAKMLRGAQDGKPENTVPAVIGFEVEKAGSYTLWVHSRDFSSNPGTRYFEISINGVRMPKRFGAHGTDGWAWDNGGSIELKEGVNRLELIDTAGNFGRVDAIMLVNGIDLPPVDSQQDMVNSYNQYKAVVTKPPLVNDVDSYKVRSDGLYRAVIDGRELLSGIRIENEHKIIPVRETLEAVGMQVEWNDSTRTVSASDKNNSIELILDNNAVNINRLTHICSVAPVLIEGVSYMPLDILVEAFLAEVTDDDKSKTIFVSVPKTTDIRKDNTYFLNYKSFNNLGTWEIENAPDGFGGKILRGLYPKGDALPNPDAAKPASAEVIIKNSGKYNIWIHAKDYATNQQGSRFYEVAVNGENTDKIYGAHGKEGYEWELAGTFDLPEGKNEIELIDTSAFYARCDGVFITEDLEYVPPGRYDDVVGISELVENKFSGMPEHIRENKQPIKTETIGNENIKVNFRLISTDEGNAVQRETLLNSSGTWYTADRRTDGLAYLLLYADSTAYAGLENLAPIFEQVIDGKVRKTTYVFNSGKQTWMIPDRMEKVSENEMILYAENEYGTLKADWLIEEEAKEPLVTLTFDIKKKGAYSIGIFNVPELTDNSYEYALLPFRYHSKQLSGEAQLVNEQYAFTPMSSVTLSETKSLSRNEKITYGLVVEPSSATLKDWVYDYNSKFGLGIRGDNGGVYPYLFAPQFGVETANFEAGDIFTFKYRPITAFGDWYNTFEHVAKDIYKVEDYRSNYYSSLTDAIFNTMDLINDDEAAGWDNNVKQYYNMEGRNFTGNSNPLVSMQNYLLTQDENILERRAIPDFASLLSKSEINFYDGKTPGGAYYVVNSQKAGPTAMGNPKTGFNTSTFGCANMMTGGLTNKLQEVAVGNGVRYVNSYGSIPEFAEKLWYYKYTGDESYLEAAKKGADEYIRNEVYKEKTKEVAKDAFINISYYPNFPALIDLYEVTQEQSYLKAATYIAEILTTCVWNTGLTGVSENDTITITNEDVTKKDYKYNSTSFFWKGDKIHRLGSEIGWTGQPRNLDSIEDETVPSWVPSRVGLSIEQATTFTDSCNITMSNWAPDLIRLSKYSGNEYFETVARNAIIGRFSNYPGYYQNRNMVFQMKPDYPFVGPDMTSIYYHHIPAFMAMETDFLFSQAWAWSDMKIDFPYGRMQGFAYFNSRMYGFEPGKFFNEDGVWLWLDRDIIKSENKQIDWFAARKEGTLCLALMNESKNAEKEVFTLGNKISGGSKYNGTGIVYYPDGSESTVNFTDGTAEITINGHSLIGIVLKLDGITAPSYADSFSATGRNYNENECKFDFGSALTMQVERDKYYAYVYATDFQSETSKVELIYTKNGKKYTETDNEYPYEFIIPMNSSEKFNFEIRTTGPKGNKIAKGALSAVIQ